MGNYLDKTGLAYFWGKLKDYFQPKLVSGTNIKTVNGNSLLGSGDIATPNTTYSDFEGTDGTSDGTAGLVPAPETTDAGKYLKADGTWGTPSGGGGSYTATSPIAIDANNDISLEDSGVTAGTYLSVQSSKGVLYPRSFAVDSKGRVTDVTLITSTYWDNVDTYRDAGHFISEAAWNSALRSYANNWISSSYVIPAGQTQKTLDITDSYGVNGNAYKCKVVDVAAKDNVTFERVIVDWATDKGARTSSSETLTLTVSIANAYTHDISFVPIIMYNTSK